MTAVEELYAKEWPDKSKAGDGALFGKSAWRANTVPASQITATAIRWIWPGFIPAGKLTILAGIGGGGKTTLAIGLISTLTTGGRWPDGEWCKEKKSALIWSGEDDASDTIVPRLMAAGADLNKVHILQGRINGAGEIEPFDPARDMDLIAAELLRLDDVGLILIDPIVSAVAGDMHRANDVRRSLQGLVDLAEEYGCAVLGITHFAKGTAGGSPAERVIGSQAFSALARTVLVAAKQEDSDLRVLARAKSNIAKDDGGCAYTIEECTVGDGITTTRVLWGDKIEGTAREILADVETAEPEDRRTELDDAIDFLRDTLKYGAVETKQLKKDADGNGLSWATVRRAQKIVGAKAIKAGMDKGWTWVLPGEVAHWTAEDAQESPKVFTENSEHLRESMSTFDLADAEAF